MYLDDWQTTLPSYSDMYVDLVSGLGSLVGRHYIFPLRSSWSAFFCAGKIAYPIVYFQAIFPFSEGTFYGVWVALYGSMYDCQTLTPGRRWDGPVLWTKLIRVPFQGECTAVVAAWVSTWSAANSWGVRYPNEECGRMLL